MTTDNVKMALLGINALLHCSVTKPVSDIMLGEGSGIGKSTLSAKRFLYVTVVPGSETVHLNLMIVL